jgi:hypothetical protein
VERAESGGGVRRHQAEIELIGACLGAGTGSPLGLEADLAGDGLHGHERDGGAVDQELVLAGIEVLREGPRVEGSARPEIRGQTSTAAADGRRVARADDIALALGAEGGTASSDVGWVAAVALDAVLDPGSHVPILCAPVEAHLGGHVVEEELPVEGALVVDVVDKQTI